MSTQSTRHNKAQRFRAFLRLRRKQRAATSRKLASIVARFARPPSLIVTGQLSGMGGMLLLAASSLFDISYLREIAVVLFGVGGVLTGFGRIAREQEQRQEIRKKEQEVKEIQSAPAGQEPLRAFLIRHVRAAVKREELILLKTEKRADSLHFWGVMLLISAVVCPLAAMALYWALEPLPNEAIIRLKELKSAIGEMPKDLKIEFSRDWRILVGGASFGFLCLAVARGLLTQQGRETENYFRIEEKINYYERLAGAVEIRLRQLEDGEEDNEKLMEFVVDGLRGYRRETSVDEKSNGIAKNDGIEKDKDEQSSMPEFAKSAIEAVKAAKGGLS